MTDVSAGDGPVTDVPPPATPRQDLVDRLLAGDRRALARVLTRIENGDRVGAAASARLYAHGGRAHVVGVTGPPGAGKSTLVGALIGAYREQGRSVGVVAVDPSSPMSGGATLGDRIRMGAWHGDDQVFVRSMASRGHGGGVARATTDLVDALDAAGFNPVIVETVGAGQGEIDVAALTHTTLLVQVPGTGDAVQTLKAGGLEVGDILVVGKGDLPGAAGLEADLRGMLTLAEPDPPSRRAVPGQDAWPVRVIRVSAQTQEGVAELADAIDAHRAHLARSGEIVTRLRARAEATLLARLRALLEAQVAGTTADRRVADAVAAVAARTRTPDEALASVLTVLAERGAPWAGAAANNRSASFGRR